MNSNQSDEEEFFSRNKPLAPEGIMDRLRRAHEERVMRRGGGGSSSASDVHGHVELIDDWSRQQTSDIESGKKQSENHQEMQDLTATND
jgi:hypothetical protein